jgi:hypothetical protein
MSNNRSSENDANRSDRLRIPSPGSRVPDLEPLAAGQGRLPNTIARGDDDRRGLVFGWNSGCRMSPPFDDEATGY